jgi:hypothetical protein
MDGIIAKVPSPLLAAFAGVGALVVSSKIISYTRLLSSLFVLPGKNVRSMATLEKP